MFVSDMDNGAYVMRLDPITHDFTASAPTVSPGGVVSLDFSFKNDSVAPLGGFGMLLIWAINDVPQPLSFLVDPVALAPQQSRPWSIPLAIPRGFPTGVDIDFRAYSGLIDPLIVSEQTDVRVTVQ